MNYLYVSFLSLGSVLVLFFLTKLIGNRQISQLSFFDYIVGITIGSIAAEMATDVDENFMYAVIAMAVYALLSFFLSVLSDRSLKMRKFLSGSSLLLFENGQLKKENFKKARLDLSEFLSQCRIAGYFDLEEIQAAYLEPNGNISILKKSQKSPPTAEDLKINVAFAEAQKIIIADGVLLEENLAEVQTDKKRVYSQLKTLGITDISEVFLATYVDGSLKLY